MLTDDELGELVLMLQGAVAAGPPERHGSPNRTRAASTARLQDHQACGGCPMSDEHLGELMSQCATATPLGRLSTVEQEVVFAWLLNGHMTRTDKPLERPRVSFEADSRQTKKTEAVSL